MNDLRNHYPGGLYAVRNLSHVPRWAIVAILQQQSVADHSFQVMVLFKVFASMSRITDAELLWGYEWLLRHDIPESLTGDHPSVCKDENWSKVEDKVNEEIQRARPELFDGSMLPDPGGVLVLCELADVMEAFLKCFDEVMSGNGFAYGAYEYNRDKVKVMVEKVSQVRYKRVADYVLNLVDDCDAAIADR